MPRNHNLVEGLDLSHISHHQAKFLQSQDLNITLHANNSPFKPPISNKPHSNKHYAFTSNSDMSFDRMMDKLKQDKQQCLTQLDEVQAKL